MKIIKFPNAKERNRALSFILGEVLIKWISMYVIGVLNNTAKELRNTYRAKFRILKSLNQSVYCSLERSQYDKSVKG